MQIITPFHEKTYRLCGYCLGDMARDANGYFCLGNRDIDRNPILLTNDGPCVFMLSTLPITFISENYIFHFMSAMWLNAKNYIDPLILKLYTKGNFSYFYETVYP